MNDQDPVRLCTGSIRVGCVDTNSLRPAEIPVAVFKKISNANASMLAAGI
jgi:acyl-CoA thioesterase FadM